MKTITVDAKRNRYRKIVFQRLKNQVGTGGINMFLGAWCARKNGKSWRKNITNSGGFNTQGHLVSLHWLSGDRVRRGAIGNIRKVGGFKKAAHWLECVTVKIRGCEG